MYKRQLHNKHKILTTHKFTTLITVTPGIVTQPAYIKGIVVIYIAVSYTHLMLTERLRKEFRRLM